MAQQAHEGGGRIGGVTFGNAAAFWIGVALVTGGVIAHLPMYLMGKDMGYRLAGMPMETPMKVGMVAILVGLVVSLYGLLPRTAPTNAALVSKLRVSALDDAPLTPAHWGLVATMMLAVTIDIMKPTTLAFVMPGMTMEYGLKGPLNPTGTIPVAYVSLAGITGTVLGSFLWGWLGDRIGRRASILYAGIGFIGTSICGAMPGFAWNLVMCFVMGLAVGGMLPICYSLLAETIPARHRSWMMILVGADIAGAYIITSWLAAALVPTYSWRILWLIGLPTGVLFILLNRWIPESPRFLLANGRDDEAHAVMKRFGAVIVEQKNTELEVETRVQSRWSQLLSGELLWLTSIVGVPRARLGAGAVRIQPLDPVEPAEARHHRRRRHPAQRGDHRVPVELPRGVAVRLLEQQEDHHPPLLAHRRGAVRLRVRGQRGREQPRTAVPAARHPDLGDQLRGRRAVGVRGGDLSHAHPLARLRLRGGSEQGGWRGDHRSRRVRRRRARRSRRWR